jgi:Tfp pilus assembly protein PilF
MLAAMSGEGDVKSVSLVAAERAYRRAIALDPNMVMYRHDYGRFLIGVGRRAEAEEQARIARTLPDRGAADAWLRDNLSALIARRDSK